MVFLQAFKLTFGKLVDSPETPPKGKKRSGSKKADVRSALTDLVETIVEEELPVYVVASLLRSLSLIHSEVCQSASFRFGTQHIDNFLG